LITDDGVDLRDLAAKGQDRAIGTAAEEAAKNQLIRKTVDDQTFTIGKVNQRSEYYGKLADLAQSLPQGTQMVDASTNEAWSVQASESGITLTNDTTGQTATLQQNETGTWTRTGEGMPPSEFKLRGNLAPTEQAAETQGAEAAPQQAEMLPAQPKPQPVQKNMIERALDRLTSEGATGPEINQQIAELERIQAGIAKGNATEEQVLQYLEGQQRYDMVRVIDPDAIKLDSKGQPFASEEAAQKSQPFRQGKKLASVVPYGEGFAVRIDTAAQRQAELDAMRKKEEKSRKAKERYYRPIDPNRDDLLTAIALAGGINRKHAVEQGIDPDMLNIRGNHNAPVFTNEGDTADGMAQTLGQYGYINADSNREQDLLNKLMRAVNGGQRIMTPDGAILVAEEEAAKRAEMEAAEQQGAPVETVVSDYIVEARQAGVPEETIQSILDANQDDAVIAAVDLQHETQIRNTAQEVSVRSETGTEDGGREDGDIDFNGGETFTPEAAAEIFGEPEPLLTSYTEQDLQERAEQENNQQAQQNAEDQRFQENSAEAFTLGTAPGAAGEQIQPAVSGGPSDMFGASSNKPTQPEAQTQQSEPELTQSTFRIEEAETSVRVYGDPAEIRKQLRAGGFMFKGAEIEGGLSFGKKQGDRIRSILGESAANEQALTEQASDQPKDVQPIGSELQLPEGAVWLEGKGRVAGKWKVGLNGDTTPGDWNETKEQALEQFSQYMEQKEIWQQEAEATQKARDSIRDGGSTQIAPLGVDSIEGKGALADELQAIFGGTNAAAQRFVKKHGVFERNSAGGSTLYNTVETIKKAQSLFADNGSIDPLNQAQSKPASTEQAEPEAAGQPALQQASTGMPWEMTRAEWEAAREQARPNNAQSNYTRASGSEAAARISTVESLLYGVYDDAQAQLKSAVAGEIELTPDQVESLMERINTPVQHRDVIAKALREGQPVPDNVLTEYPDLQQVQQAETEAVQQPDDLAADRNTALEIFRQLGRDWPNVTDMAVAGNNDGAVFQRVRAALNNPRLTSEDLRAIVSREDRKAAFEEGQQEVLQPVSEQRAQQLAEEMTPEQIRAELADLTATAQSRMDEAVETNGADALPAPIDYLTDSERERFNELQQALPSQAQERAVARQRIEQRAAERKAKREQRADNTVTANGITVEVPTIDQQLVDDYNRATHMGRGRDLNAELRSEAEGLLNELSERQYALDTPEQRAEAKRLIESYLQAQADFSQWDARYSANNPSWIVTGRSGRNMDKSNRANERHMDEYTKRVDRLQAQRDRIGDTLYKMRPQEVQENQALSADLRSITQQAGHILGYLEEGKNALVAETRKWASPKAHKLIERSLESDRGRTIEHIRELENTKAVQDAGGLVKVFGPRSKAGKLVNELLNEQTPQFSRRPQTETEAFRRWFGDSKVVDENGDPSNPDIRFSPRNEVTSENTATEGNTNEGIDQLNEALQKAGETATARRAVLDTLTGGKRQAAEFAEALASAFGQTITWVQTDTALFDGVTVNGQLFVDVDSSVPYHIVMGHELTHILRNEHPDLYAQLESMILPDATARSESAEFHRFEEGSVKANEEYVADVVGNRFGERKFWADMAATEPSLFRRVAAIVRSLIQRVTDQFKSDRTLYGDAVKDLNRVRNQVAGVMMEYRRRQKAMSAQEFRQSQTGDLRFSLRDRMRRGGESEADLSAVAKAQRTLGNNDRNVWGKVKRTFKRNFTAAGLLPDSVFREKVLRDSEVNAHEFDTAHYIGALDRAINKAYGTPYRKLTDAQREAIDAQMKSTEPDMSIPEPVRVALMDMRRSIAGLSQQYAEILQQQVNELEAGITDAERVLLDTFNRMQAIQPEGDTPAQKAAATRERNRILDEAKDRAKEAGVGNLQSALANAANVAEKQGLIQTIINNMDTYAHRSYRAFDDPDWPAKVSKDPEIWPQAVAYLQQQYEGQGMTADQAEQRAIRTARTILEEGTAYEDMSSFIKESKLGSKDLSTLKRRKDIAPEIRALLGEYKDVKINYAKTLAKMSRLVANTKLLDRIKEIGLAEGWLFTEDNKPLDQSVTKVAGDASEVYAPLNGYYVPNEINQALIDTLGKEQMADWLRAVIRMNGMVKYGKTVLSPTTAFRNWMSAAFFAMANGHFDITQMRKSISGFSEYFGHGENPEKVAYLRKLKELGVVYDTAYAGEMMDLLADAKGGWAERLFEKPGLSSLKAANELAQKFYQYGDDFWKIMGFENEKAMLMKHKGMSEAEAEVEAAERIRNTYPTYSMTGRAVNWLRRFPLAGTFVSFPAEVIRTQFHMLRYLKQDWKDSPAYAARKVVGLAMVSGLAYAAQALSKDLFDIGDDEEEAVRLLAASWNSNSNIWFMGRDEKGSIRYLDFSFLDPYSYFKRPINAVMRDQPLDKAAIQAAGEMLSPFFGTDIAFGAISEIWNNKKEGGGRVYNPQDMALDQAQSIANHLRKAIQPGFVGNLERAWMAANDQVTASGKKYKAEEELAAFFGFRASTFDPKTALYYNSFEFKDRKRDATAVLMNVAKDPNRVSDSDLMRAYDTASRARLRAYTDMIRLVQAARAAGMNNMHLNASLRRSGISKADIRALMQGRIPAWRPDQSMMRNTIRKAELLYGPEVVREMREREQAIIRRGYRE